MVAEGVDKTWHKWQSRWRVGKMTSNDCTFLCSISWRMRLHLFPFFKNLSLAIFRIQISQLTPSKKSSWSLNALCAFKKCAFHEYLRINQSCLSVKYYDSSGEYAKVSSLQGMEVELRSIQGYSLQSEGYLVQLDDRLSSLSSSTSRNLTGLNAEVTRASTWLRDQDLLLRYALRLRRRSSFPKHTSVTTSQGRLCTL